jgi:hypothetical protein
MEQTKLCTVGDLAKRYETQSKLPTIDKAGNISLQTIIHEGNGKDMLGVEYMYFYIEVDNTKYRVPKSVLKQLNGLVSKLPMMWGFQVIRTGNTKDDTTYQVIPLQDYK